MNSYSWCGNATFESSTYSDLVTTFSNTTVPVFFSEFGCNEVTPRIFTEVQAIYGPEMTGVMSGGLVYEYDQGSNDFGLVQVNADGSAQLLQDYVNLQNEYDMLNLVSLQTAPATNTTKTPPDCNADLITESGFSTNFTAPAVPPGAQDLIDNGIANPNTGKIISITQTVVSQTVESVNSAVMTSLMITPAGSSATATTSGQSTTSGQPTQTKTGTSATATKKGAAGRESVSISLITAFVAAVVVGVIF